jgi:hypothetical protein
MMAGDGAAHGEAASVPLQLCSWKEEDGVLGDGDNISMDNGFVVASVGEGQMMKGSTKSTKRKADVVVAPTSEDVCMSASPKGRWMSRRTVLRRSRSLLTRWLSTNATTTIGFRCRWTRTANYRR